MSFKTPHAHDDIELESSSHFYVKHVSEINSDADAKAYIAEVKDALINAGGSFVNITSQGVFDVAYSLSLNAKRISPENFRAFTGVLKTAFCRLSEAIATTELANTLAQQSVSEQSADAFKMYTFLASMNAKLGLAAIKKESTHTKTVASKRSKKQEFSKKAEVLAVCTLLEMLLAAAKSNFKRFWHMGLPEEDFLALFTKPALAVFEIEPLVQKGIDLSCRGSAVQLCAHVASSFPTLVSANLSVAMQHLISAQAHAVPVIVDVLATLDEMGRNAGISANQSSGLPGAVLGETLGMSDLRANRDSPAVRNVAAFLEDLASTVPHFMHANRMVVLPLLNCKCYTIRNAVINTLGKICSISRTSAEIAEESSKSGGNADESALDKETRDELLDLLLERAHDISAYCRSRCLRTWVDLCETGAIPRTKLLPAVLAASDRLADKSAIVRKAALTFLEKVFEHCPFQEDEIAAEHYADRLATAKDELAAMVQAVRDNRKQATTTEEMLEHENQDEAAAQGAEFDYEGCGDEGIRKQALIVTYYEDYTAFAREIESVVMPRMCQLLGSKNDSDIVGVLHFFRSIHSRRVRGVSAGIRKMLPLILASEGVQKEVLSLFHFLFLKDKSPQQAALNLVECCAGITLSDHAALSMVIHRLVEDKPCRIPTAVFDSLRKFACYRLPEEQRQNASAQESLVRRQRYSLCLLAMGAEVAAGKILGKPSHIGQLGAAIFDDTNGETPLDIPKAQFAFKLLQFVPESQRDTPQVRSLLAQAYKFLAWDDEQPATDKTELDWYGAAEWAVGAIFEIASRPVAEFGAFLRAQSIQLFGESTSVSGGGIVTARLSHFLFLLGQFAVKIVVLAEELATEVKRRRRAFQKRPKIAAEGATEEEEQKRIEEEMGLNASREKPEDEVLQRLQDSGIAASNTFIGAFAPAVVEIAMNGETGVDTRLRETATLCLCQMMCISRKFCVDHLQILFTVLTRSTLQTVRSNIAVALGDLAFRFPLEFDPWKKHLYARLEDKDTTVRKNALMVLSHLVLNDMIKLTGFAHTLAKCLEDPEPRIVDFAKLFFSEFHAKGVNNMYNILVDTLSCLTQDESVSMPAFQRMAKYLCDFVTKDVQIASVVTKLCVRINVATEPEAWQNLSFCLSLFTYGDRASKKIVEAFDLYKTALNDPTTQATFASIAAKIVRSLKEGADEASNVQEWASKIAKANLCASGTIAEEGEEEDDVEVSDGEEDVEAAAAAEAGAEGQSDDAMTAEQDEDCEEDTVADTSDSENSEEEFENEVVPAKETKKGRSSRKNKVAQPSLDENSHPNNRAGRRVQSQ